MIQWLKSLLGVKSRVERRQVLLEKEIRLVEAFTELARLTKDLQADDKNLVRIRSQIVSATDVGLAILENTHDGPIR